MKQATVHIFWACVASTLLVESTQGQSSIAKKAMDSGPFRAIRSNTGKGPSAAECEFCTEVIQCAQEDLSNHDDEDVIDALYHACEQCFSSEQKTHCEDFVEQNGQMLDHLLENEAPPYEICVELDICPNSGSVGRRAAWTQ